MTDICEGKTIDYDKISRRVLRNAILKRSDFEITPKALNEILLIIANLPSCEELELEREVAIGD
ncbi:MAG: hypothetical protein Q4A15_03940 [Prevotellaceae bacterium]|nr:hypothetical protein [Prevotellaceae bacterium]